MFPFLAYTTLQFKFVLAKWPICTYKHKNIFQLNGRLFCKWLFIFISLSLPWKVAQRDKQYTNPILLSINILFETWRGNWEPKCPYTGSREAILWTQSNGRIISKRILKSVEIGCAILMLHAHCMYIFQSPDWFWEF